MNCRLCFYPDSCKCSSFQLLANENITCEPGGRWCLRGAEDTSLLRWKKPCLWMLLRNLCLDLFSSIFLKPHAKGVTWAKLMRIPKPVFDLKDHLPSRQEEKYWQFTHCVFIFFLSVFGRRISQAIVVAGRDRERCCKTKNKNNRAISMFKKNLF